MALDAAEQIHLCWITTPGHSHYAGNLCRSWEDALDNFHYTALEADAEAAVAGVLAEYLQSMGNPGQFDFYACLPESLLEAAGTAADGKRRAGCTTAAGTAAQLVLFQLGKTGADRLS